jgi:hypothetical protein
MLSWINVSVVNFRFFSKKKYKHVLWVFRDFSGVTNTSDVYHNIMRIVSLLKTDNRKWRNEALWLIKRNKFGNVSSDEREYLTQYLNQQSNGELERYCTYEAINYENITHRAIKIFPLKDTQ